MRLHKTKQINFVKSLLECPKWYNETITHKNWPLIKKSIQKYQPIPLVNMPPKLQENYEKLDSLMSWHRSYRAYVLQPPARIIGVAVA